ncbi:MAG: FlgD immunoglobulin-like domain containing protein, partial [Candidatus Latescibacterota bacterium]
WAGDEMTVAKPFSLSCTPDKFNTSVMVEFNLPASDSVILEIYDSRNEKVTEIINAYLRRGRHSFVWNALDAQGRRAPDGKYYVLLKTPQYSASNNIFFPASVAEEDGRDTPQVLSISCFPNPFNAVITIEFDLPAAGTATLEIYNSQGQRVRQLTNSRLNRGRHAATWHADDDQGKKVSSGPYFAYLRTSDHSISKKLTLLK